MIQQTYKSVLRLQEKELKNHAFTHARTHQTTHERSH